MTTMHSVAETIAEVIRRQRQLWGGVCWLIALYLSTYGVVYLVLGKSATSVPGAFAALTSWLWGGMHTYGGLLLLAGLSLIYGLLNALHSGESMRDGYLHNALRFVIAACGSAAGLFAASWYLSGIITWPSILVWTIFGLFALVLFRVRPYPPPSPTRVA